LRLRRFVRPSIHSICRARACHCRIAPHPRLLSAQASPTGPASISPRAIEASAAYLRAHLGYLERPRPFASLTKARPSSTTCCACLGSASPACFRRLRLAAWCRSIAIRLHRSRVVRSVPLALPTIVRTVFKPRFGSSAIVRNDSPALRRFKTSAHCASLAASGAGFLRMLCAYSPHDHSRGRVDQTLGSSRRRRLALDPSEHTACRSSPPCGPRGCWR
jgi:hypothetical protein